MAANHLNRAKNIIEELEGAKHDNGALRKLDGAAELIEKVADFLHLRSENMEHDDKRRAIKQKVSMARLDLKRIYAAIDIRKKSEDHKVANEN